MAELETKTARELWLEQAHALAAKHAPSEEFKRLGPCPPVEGGVRVEIKEALVAARSALHELLLERGSTDGYRATFEQINAALEMAHD